MMAGDVVHGNVNFVIAQKEGEHSTFYGAARNTYCLLDSVKRGERLKGVCYSSRTAAVECYIRGDRRTE